MVWAFFDCCSSQGMLLPLCCLGSAPRQQNPCRGVPIISSPISGFHVCEAAASALLHKSNPSGAMKQKQGVMLGFLVLVSVPKKLRTATAFSHLTQSFFFASCTCFRNTSCYCYYFYYLKFTPHSLLEAKIKIWVPFYQGKTKCPKAKTIQWDPDQVHQSYGNPTYFFPHILQVSPEHSAHAGRSASSQG